MIADPQLMDRIFSTDGEVDIGGPSPVIAAARVNICIRCIVQSGDPTPMVIFSNRRGQVNLGDNRLSLNENGSLCVKVDSAVDGMYTCTAMNIAGSDSKNIVIQVAGETSSDLLSSPSISNLSNSLSLIP